MANNIVWKRPDGGISVTHLTSETEDSSAEHAKFLQDRGDIPADWVWVAEDIELPEDRHFRDAWSWETDEPVVDINKDKAVEVTKNRLRSEREPKFKELDLQFIQALESGDTKAIEEIKEKKQKLRDVTKLAHKKLSLDKLKELKAE
jgi:hypothetical protein